MNIKFKNYGGDGSEQVTSIEEYVRHRLRSEEDGFVETAYAEAVSAQFAIGRLADVLVSKGVIDVSDIATIVGTAWKGDDIALTDQGKTFFVDK